MSHQLRVDDFVEELRKYDRKDDFMAVMRQYEQKYYDQFEQYANNNFPPELQRQPKQETSWRQQPQVPIQKPPIVRSSSANKIDYSDPYQVFPQQSYQIPQRPPSRGELQDPFKRPQDQYDFRTSPIAQQDPFRGVQVPPVQQQYIQQPKPMMQGPQIGLFSPFQTTQTQQQPITQMQPQIPPSFPAQLNPQLFPNLPQQFEQQPYQQQYQSYQKGAPQQQQQMDAFLTEIKQQRMMKQQQQK